MIIGFSGRMGCGKTTAAKYLVANYNFRRVRFAGPLKAMMAALGLSQEEIEGSLKETPCDLLCGKTPRWAMQSIGTEWGRDMIGSELLVNAWHRARIGHELVVVDDVRFENEAAAIKSAGGVLVRIRRDNTDDSRLVHASEQQIFVCDEMWVNNSTPTALYAAVDELLRQEDKDRSWALAAA
jgi:hypothetical protein